MEQEQKKQATQEVKTTFEGSQSQQSIPKIQDKDANKNEPQEQQEKKNQQSNNINVQQLQQKKEETISSSLNNTANQTITKAQLTLTQTRDPIQPNKTKHDDVKQKTIQEITKAEEQRKNENKSVSVQRPITINYTQEIMHIQIPQQSDLNQFKQSDVKIQIKQTTEKGFALNKQLYYRINGFDNHGSIDIQRKFNQFQSLRKILLERWPGCFIPPLSYKSQIKNQQIRNQHKKRHLQKFLKKLSYCQQIYYKEQIQLFLRSIGIQIQQMFSQMPILRARDVIQRFKACFGQKVQKQNSPQNASIIARFSTSLKKIANNLSSLSKKALKLAESFETYQLTLPKFSKILNSYQQTCLSEYTSDPDCSIALKQKEGKMQRFTNLTSKHNVFYDLYYLIEQEQKDAETLSDIILAMQMFGLRRDELQTQSKQARLEIDQISLGYKNIKVMTTRRTKEQVQAELQQKQKNLIQEKHVINELAGIAQILLATVTIPMFKRMKTNAYFSIIKKWVNLIGETNSEIFQVWKYLGQQSRLLLKKCKE